MCQILRGGATGGWRGAEGGPARPGHGGFTLVEMVVVVAIIAALAGISIPVVLRSRLSANGQNAAASLRLLAVSEQVWAAQDLDRNGKQDFWTLDVRGFHGVRAANGAAVALVDPAVACSDRNPAVTYAAPANRTVPKNGYYLRAMTRDETGAAYVDRSLPTAKAAPVAGRNGTHLRRFGFSAYPAVYNTDGVMCFMVGEDGVLWQLDSRSGPFLDRSAAAPPGKNKAPSGPWSQVGN
jgi:prepilin-type N-terminal cleavage/methylation domain-containing protein